jgi:DNA-binding MarR family transcriptional regulator
MEQPMQGDSSLPTTMSYLLAQVCKLHRQRADDLLREVGLHVGQEMLLCSLWEREGVTQTELSEALGVQPATVTNALKRLERKGLVLRVSDAEDQRVSRVSLTTEGRDMKAVVEERWALLEQASFAGITAPERDLLRDLLLRVYGNLAGKTQE